VGTTKKLPPLATYPRYMRVEVRAALDGDDPSGGTRLMKVVLSRLQQRALHAGEPVQRLCVSQVPPDVGDFVVKIQFVAMTQGGKAQIRSTLRPAGNKDSAADFRGYAKTIRHTDATIAADDELDSDSSETGRLTEVGKIFNISFTINNLYALPDR
jgi:hypothetical protein